MAPAGLRYLDLTQLNGTNGFKIQDHLPSENFGGFTENNTGLKTTGPVSAGDVNGDGYDDLIVGASSASNGAFQNGAAYVIFGRPKGFSAALDVASLNGVNGFRIQGAAGGDHAGSSVSPAGDVNGDGYDDLLVTAGYSLQYRDTQPGVSYVVFGKASFGSVFDLSSLNGRNGFKIEPEAANQFTGLIARAAGDVNGDGYDDIIASTEGYALGRNDNATQHPSYLIFGQANGFSSSFSLDNLKGHNGFKLVGEISTTGAEQLVSGAGDLNHDGYDDFVVAAWLVGRPTPYPMTAYVVFGHAAGFSTPIDLTKLNGNTGFTIRKSVADPTSHPAGSFVTASGDLNGDGIDDLSITAQEGSSHELFGGTSYVIYGKTQPFNETLDLDDLHAADGFVLKGYALRAGGDINGDGYNDFLAGNRVIYGRTGDFNPAKILATLQAVDVSDYFQRPLQPTGDLNGDGFADLLIGTVTSEQQVDYNRVLTSYVILSYGAPATDSPVTFSRGHKSGIFDDGLGKIVTVKITKGHLGPANFLFNTSGEFLGLDLSATEPVAGTGGPVLGPTVLSGSDLSVTAITKATPLNLKIKNAPADVLTLDAHGLDLGKVSISGRVGGILAGDAMMLTPGLTSLTVGALGTESVLGVNHVTHITIAGSLGALTVKGSASAIDFDVQGSIGKIIINGALDAASITQGAGGFIHATGDIGPVRVDRGIYGGADFSGIAAGGTLGKVTIGGALISFDPAKPVTLSALGHLDATTSAQAVAIIGLSVRKNVVNARILAGYTPELAATNADAGIGPIVIQGFWTGSSAAAGVNDANGDGFGRNDTALLPDSTPDLFSKIARLTIKGTAIGSATYGTFFGITAQTVGKVSINGKSLPASTVGTPIDLDPNNHNFRLVRL